MEKLILTPFLNAYAFMTEALNVANSDLEKAGAIQRFEYCFELSWKFLKRTLSFRGIEVNSPRETFRTAAKEKLIEDPKIWFDFIRLRNITVHTYNEGVANEIFAQLPNFLIEMTKLKTTLEQL